MFKNLIKGCEIPIPLEFKKFVDYTLSSHENTPYSISFNFWSDKYGMTVKMTVGMKHLKEIKQCCYLISHLDMECSKVYPNEYIRIFANQIGEMKNELQRANECQIRMKPKGNNVSKKYKVIIENCDYCCQRKEITYDDGNRILCQDCSDILYPQPEPFCDDINKELDRIYKGIERSLEKMKAITNKLQEFAARYEDLQK